MKKPNKPNKMNLTNLMLRLIELNPSQKINVFLKKNYILAYEPFYETNWLVKVYGDV